MAALSSAQKLNNLKKGMELYMEGRFGWEKPIIVDTFVDPMGEYHGVKFHVHGTAVILTEKIPDGWLANQPTGFEYRPNDEIMAQLMLLVG
jgi:hypothetical protein